MSEFVIPSEKTPAYRITKQAQEILDPSHADPAKREQDSFAFLASEVSKAVRQSNLPHVENILEILDQRFRDAYACLLQRNYNIFVANAYILIPPTRLLRRCATAVGNKRLQAVYEIFGIALLENDLIRDAETRGRRFDSLFAAWEDMLRNKNPHV